MGPLLLVGATLLPPSEPVSAGFEPPALPILGMCWEVEPERRADEGRMVGSDDWLEAEGPALDFVG